MKNQKGFTLVEVIVVAVIVAILAAVAVPIYLNYVENSRENQANNIAGAVASFCGACAAESGVCTVDAAAGDATSGEAGCAINGTTITLPQGYDVNITPRAGATDGSVQAVSRVDATIMSLSYNF